MAARAVISVAGRKIQNAQDSRRAESKRADFQRARA